MPRSILTNPRDPVPDLAAAAAAAAANAQQPPANAAPRAPRHLRADSADLGRRGLQAGGSEPRGEAATRAAPPTAQGLLASSLLLLRQPFLTAEAVATEIGKLPLILRARERKDRVDAEKLGQLAASALESLGAAELVLLHDNLARPQGAMSREHATILEVLRTQVASRVAQFPDARRSVLGEMQTQMLTMGTTARRDVLLEDLAARLDDGSVQEPELAALLQVIPSTKLADIASATPSPRIARLLAILRREIDGRHATRAANVLNDLAALSKMMAGAPRFRPRAFVEGIRDAALHYQLYRRDHDDRDERQKETDRWVSDKLDTLEPHLQAQLTAMQLLPGDLDRTNPNSLLASLASLGFGRVARQLADAVPPPPDSPDSPLPPPQPPLGSAESPPPPPRFDPHSPESPLPPPDEIPPPPDEVAPAAKQPVVSFSGVASVVTAVCEMMQTGTHGGELLRTISTALDTVDAYRAAGREKAGNLTMVDSIRAGLDVLFGTGSFQLSTLTDPQRRALRPLLLRLGFDTVGIPPLLLGATRAERLRLAISHLQAHMPDVAGALPLVAQALREANTMADEDRVLNAESRSAKLLSNVVADLDADALESLRDALDTPELRGLASAAGTLATMNVLEPHPALRAQLASIAADLASLRSAVTPVSRLPGRWRDVSFAEACALPGVRAALSDTFPLNLGATGRVTLRLGVATGPAQEALRQALDSLDAEAPLAAIETIPVSAMLDRHLSAPGARFVLLIGEHGQQDLTTPISGETSQSPAYHVVMRLFKAGATDAQLTAISRLLADPAGILRPLAIDNAPFLRGPEGQPIVPVGGSPDPLRFELRMQDGVLHLAVGWRLAGITGMRIASGRDAGREDAVRTGHDWARFGLDIRVGAKGERSESLRYEFDIQPDELHPRRAWSDEHGKPYLKPERPEHVFGPGVHPQLLEELMAYAKREFNDENLRFCRAAREYLAAPSLAGWATMFDLFVRPGTMNLKSDNRRLCERAQDAFLHASSVHDAAALAAATAAVQGALHEISALFMHDTVGRFVNAPGTRRPEEKA